MLINGAWRISTGARSFRAVDPQTRQPLADEFPVSDWDEIQVAIRAAQAAFVTTRNWPGSRFAEFLEAYASEIEKRIDPIVQTAHRETALPVEPRLKSGEMVRTLNQLRQAAAAARDGSWKQATLDTKAGIRSILGPIGPVVVFGPNNFPLAFNSIAGGDFASAVAAGNPVIAKGHSSHPHTTKLFAEAADAASRLTNFPPGFVQLIYRTSHEDGVRLVADPLIGATGYTGSRKAGLALKEASDRVGKPIYVELSSINPVFILPGALQERGAAIVDEFVASVLMGTGQLCTNPGLVVMQQGPDCRCVCRRRRREILEGCGRHITGGSGRVEPEAGRRKAAKGRSGACGRRHSCRCCSLLLPEHVVADERRSVPQTSDGTAGRSVWQLFTDRDRRQHRADAEDRGAAGREPHRLPVHGNLGP